MKVVYQKKRKYGRYHVQIFVCLSRGWDWIMAVEDPYRFKWTAVWCARSYERAGYTARVVDMKGER